jgi:hypothetical protein
MQRSPSRTRARQRWLTLLLAFLFLGPSMFGFVTKFVEFIHTFRGTPDGIFAITPIINYLLASLGFLCMLIWATWNGMFDDIERPKYSMLENEAALDRQTP